MRVLTRLQGTPEWHLARKGRITASCINKVLAGKGTKGRQEYGLQLVLDLENIADFADSASWYEEGRKYESYARGWYSWDKNADVDETGFVLHPKYNWFGCSPDGLVGDDGCLEIKYRKSTGTYEEAITKPIPRMYDYQMQAQMAVLEREWCDYVNYWRNDATGQEQGHTRRVHRDDGKIRELEEAAMLFWRDVVEYYQKRTGNDTFSFPWDLRYAKGETA